MTFLKSTHHTLLIIVDLLNLTLFLLTLLNKTRPFRQIILTLLSKALPLRLNSLPNTFGGFPHNNSFLLQNFVHVFPPLNVRLKCFFELGLPPRHDGVTLISPLAIQPRQRINALASSRGSSFKVQLLRSSEILQSAVHSALFFLFEKQVLAVAPITCCLYC